MAIVLFAVLIAIVAGHVVPDLARLRDFSWFAAWLRNAATRFGGTRMWQSGAGVFCGYFARAFPGPPCEEFLDDVEALTIF